MFKLNLKRYLFYSLLLNLLLITMVELDYILIYIFNILSILIYYFTLESQYHKPASYYKSNNLIATVFIYSLFVVVVLNVISYYYNQNYFVFSEADTVTYHRESLRMASKSFSDGMKGFLESYSFEDLGAILVISSLYQVIASNLMVNFFYVLIGVFSSLLIFRIGKKFMFPKYAYLCALAYATSSFVLWFHASGLKESVMIFLIILFFDQYYQFISRKKGYNIIFIFISLVSLLLFRPAITFLLLASVLLSFIFSKNKSPVLLMLSFIILVVSFNFFNQIENALLRFTGPNIETMIAGKESTGMVKGSLPFTYAVNALAGLIGPIPTVVSKEKALLSFFAVGLLFRVFFATFFWFGAYYAYKKKYYVLFPLIFFVLLESSSLVFILEGLELRKSLPHFFAIFLVGFWFLDFFRRKNSIK
ncbi:MAG: hypothetical protein ACI9OE_001978, partial [Mariniflexile sp.]